MAALPARLRSPRVARAFRDFCRASRETFAQDRLTQRQLRLQTAQQLRQHFGVLSEDAMVEDLRAGTDMIRYEIVQASYQQESKTYRAHIRQEHLDRVGQGGTIDLQPPPDPATLKSS
ncbi:unnamed protein product [Prorocentrum cordatum]|uniref:Complex 1 LYR protein n=1 Tax=Prorocentrum cordatum TaxID=2364126 RepID=A0ABN9WV61_9DINO|nr:unnamed protein product [Polarella glacialis]